MNVIDCNVSVGGLDSYGHKVDADMLLQQMDFYHVGHAVCFHESALFDPKAGNTEMQALARSSGGKIGFSAVLDPVLGAENLSGEGSLIERLRSTRPESVHIFPAACRAEFCTFYWDEILEAADTLALPVVIDDPYPQGFFTELPKVAEQYANAKFVLVRYGLCNSRHIFPLLRKRGNVFFTIENMLDNNQLEEICQNCSADKLLFGSGWPKRSPSGALGLAMYANISEQHRAQILCKNWEAMKP